jgi:hypothetical protein
MDAMRDESFFETPTSTAGGTASYLLGRATKGVLGFLNWLVIGTLSIIANVLLRIVWRVAIIAAIGFAICAAEMASAHMTLAAYGFGAGALVFLVARYWLNGVFRPQVVVVHN